MTAATGLSAAPYSVPKLFPLAALAGHAIFEITRIGKLLISRLQRWMDPDVARERLWGTDIVGTDIADVPARSQLQATQDAMIALPRDLRDALTLVCVDGLSYRQAADQLGIPVAALNSRVARARAILAEELGLLPRQ
ncbi:RNA polymerase sigma factor [Indioceanicola profundi]|uniref:RNA polymerase sigma factor n=1 Tax=Indioceanicola profundi TaxID=2220096 RepID=UPI0013C4C2CB|nr:sigma factor-like helix-turn-helix DNA-binding protein [Indioceanicola profundi]